MGRCLYGAGWICVHVTFLINFEKKAAGKFDAVGFVS